MSAKAPELASISTNGDAPSHDAEQFFREYAGGIYRYCARRLGSPEEAEDALQVVYLNAWRAMKRGTVPRNPNAWLLTVAENVCHSKLRARQRRTSFERVCEPAELADLAPARPEPAEGVGELSSAIAGLPENQRKALLLREWRGLSYDEIASELTVSHGAVEMLLFRARRAASKAFAAGRPEAGTRGAMLGAGIFLLPRDLISHIRSAITGASPAKVAAVLVATAAIPVAIITIPPSGKASEPASHEAERAVAPSAFYETSTGQRLSLAAARSRLAASESRSGLIPVQQTGSGDATPGPGQDSTGTGSGNQPATPTTPGTPTTSGTPATPATHATPAIPATPATPATPGPDGVPAIPATPATPATPPANSHGG